MIPIKCFVLLIVLLIFFSQDVTGRRGRGRGRSKSRVILINYISICKKVFDFYLNILFVSLGANWSADHRQVFNQAWHM